ncbi:carotenoid ester lipase precursor [Lentinus tigrinus ALCF2SS1-7]|uniref:Carboxylic ester hydrolase n=1 Tax=Lentinus tigrinus ALCF2SS1-6 TaxID=1328759 RepID=A0A5C2S650_9APHY|nr:carotenoid ester lipase precursor [Lentinus tigrinus ALCF2SS1-6]RPD68958.1 carotenoid ester lipase precursor [Lentinus tigrinus ALCF2SS1-7]
MTVFVCTLILFVHAWVGFARPSQDAPQVQLDQATVVGTVEGGTEKFLGIPYAQPPVGDLRLRPPQLLSSYNGTINATAFGDQCYQQSSSSTTYIPPEIVAGLVSMSAFLSPNLDVPYSEDCLNLNIVRPANISADAQLPVLFWIYGGGFAGGSNAMLAYNGTAIVQRSIDIGEPVIFVAVNYRLHVFGFLGGKEVKDAGLGNLGLHDQRAALRWVQHFIPSFGGDPSKVTIWGESAGSSSVFFHMFTNNGDTEGLFRAGIMNSGTSAPTKDITDVQGEYDFVVQQVGCSGASDTLACLRTVPAVSLVAAANNSVSINGYAALAGSPFLPRADGVLISQPPQQLLASGKAAKIPFIIGDVQDEGTLFSLFNMNVTTEQQLASYLRTYWFPGASSRDIHTILKLYPADPAAGSPFGTGSANAFTPQYKRIAAIQGEFFQATRRKLLARLSSTQRAYNFLSARKFIEGLGYTHGTDLFNAFGPGDMTDYFIRFTRNLDPNGGSAVHWPPFNTSARSTLQFNDGATPLNITRDTQRLDGTSVLFDLSLRFPY